MAAVLTLTATSWSQNLSKNESKSIQTFLSQPALNGGTNAQALGFNGGNPGSCPGITVEGGHVTEIDWRG